MNKFVVFFAIASYSHQKNSEGVLISSNDKDNFVYFDSLAETKDFLIDLVIKYPLTKYYIAQIVMEISIKNNPSIVFTGPDTTTEIDQSEILSAIQELNQDI